jgi:hypothetical protein
MDELLCKSLSGFVGPILSLEVAWATFGHLNSNRFSVGPPYETTQVAAAWQTVRLSVQKYIVADGYKYISSYFRLQIFLRSVEDLMRKVGFCDVDPGQGTDIKHFISSLTY